MDLTCSITCCPALPAAHLRKLRTDEAIFSAPVAPRATAGGAPQANSLRPRNSTIVGASLALLVLSVLEGVAAVAAPWTGPVRVWLEGILTGDEGARLL
jgi:hypothetical protein